MHLKVVVIFKKIPFAGAGEIYLDVTNNSALQITFTFISSIILSNFCNGR